MQSRGGAMEEAGPRAVGNLPSRFTLQDKFSVYNGPAKGNFV
jgi:rRNA maturation protein Nop10